jgi:hypothetical protein
MFYHSCLELLENGRTCSWNLKVTRAFHDWELEMVDSLLDILFSHLPMGVGEDRLITKLSAMENSMFVLFVRL